MANLTLPFFFFCKRSRRWQHLKVSPSQSINFNEHPDLKQWELISLCVHNFQRSLHMCGDEGKEMKPSCSLLTMNQLSKTILLQSCSASLIWPLEYYPPVDENWSNMTSPVLICRYSDIAKLKPTTESGCVSLLSLYEFDISYTCTFFFFLAKQAYAAVVSCALQASLLKLFA